MCRFFCCKSEKEIPCESLLKPFSFACQRSPEYQGHGWGTGSLRLNGKFSLYKSVNPIWSEPLNLFGESSLILAHARSAFQDKDIAVVNNMPFSVCKGGEEIFFVFNGEIEKVRLNIVGRTGAQKLFNLFLRFYQGNIKSALEKTVSTVLTKSRKVKACNILVLTKEKCAFVCFYTERKDYFTLYKGKNSFSKVISSMPFSAGYQWEKINNETVEAF